MQVPVTFEFNFRLSKAMQTLSGSAMQLTRVSPQGSGLYGYATNRPALFALRPFCLKLCTRIAFEFFVFQGAQHSKVCIRTASFLNLIIMNIIIAKNPLNCGIFVNFANIHAVGFVNLSSKIDSVSMRTFYSFKHLIVILLLQNPTHSVLIAFYSLGIAPKGNIMRHVAFASNSGQCPKVDDSKRVVATQKPPYNRERDKDV